MGRQYQDGIVDLTVNLQYRASDGTKQVCTSLTFPVVTAGCTDAGRATTTQPPTLMMEAATSSAVLDVPRACNYILKPSLRTTTFFGRLPEQHRELYGNCLNDADGDGVCDEEEVPGCTNPDASNYDPLATDDDGTCIIEGCTDADAQNYDAAATSDNGTCEFLIVGTQGCTYADAVNYDSAATLDDGTCEFDCTGDVGTCAYDTDGNELIGSADLLVFLSIYGLPCGD